MPRPPRLVNPEADPLTRPPLFSDRPWAFHDSEATNPRAPKETITAIARKHTVEAIQTLVYHMRNSRSPDISIAAATELLSRGWGKAPQVTGLIDASALQSGAVPLSLEDKIAILTKVADEENGIATPIPPSASVVESPNQRKPMSTELVIVHNDTPVPDESLLD